MNNKFELSKNVFNYDIDISSFEYENVFHKYSKDGKYLSIFNLQLAILFQTGILFEMSNIQSILNSITLENIDKCDYNLFVELINLIKKNYIDDNFIISEYLRSFEKNISIHDLNNDSLNSNREISINEFNFEIKKYVPHISDMKIKEVFSILSNNKDKIISKDLIKLIHVIKSSNN